MMPVAPDKFQSQN